MGSRYGFLLHFEHRPISFLGTEGVGMTADGIDHEAIAVQEWQANIFAERAHSGLACSTFPSRN